MKWLPKLGLVVLVLAMSYAMREYYRSQGLVERLATLNCSFVASYDVVPNRFALDLISVSIFRFDAKLSNPSLHDGVELWSGDGNAKIGVTSFLCTVLCFETPRGAFRVSRFGEIPMMNRCGI